MDTEVSLPHSQVPAICTYPYSNTPLQNTQKLQLYRVCPSVHPSTRDQDTSSLNICVICQIAVLYILS
jgi:hypothetical protein